MASSPSDLYGDIHQSSSDAGASQKRPLAVHRPSAVSGVKALRNTSDAKAASRQAMLAFRSLDPFRALREPDRRRRDGERPFQLRTKNCQQNPNNHHRSTAQPRAGKPLDRESPIQVRNEPDPLAAGTPVNTPIGSVPPGYPSPRASAPLRVRLRCPWYDRPGSKAETREDGNMRRSLTRIRTSHVGRLPPPKGWADMPARLAGAEITDPVVIAAKVTPAIAETVEKQIEAGIDCIGDGEFWTARNLAHYAAHFTGVEARPVAPDEPPTTRHSTREPDEFPDFYGDCDRAGSLFLVPGETPMPPMTERVVARGPLKSKRPDAINRQLDTFKAAIERSGATVEEAFVPVLAPGWLDHFIFNEYYPTEKEFLFALADAVHEEYRAVVAAGFVLQIDDP